MVDIQTVDSIVVLIANLINLVMVGIFLSRPLGYKRFEYYLGWVNILMVIPLIAAVVYNFAAGRDWWSFILPIFMIVFLFIELILDYILKSDFRKTRLLWPYLGLFYFSQWMLIGYAFLVGNVYGFVTLATYFLSLFAAWYSYARVGHGER